MKSGGLDDGLLLGRRRSAQGCAQPGQQLVHPERLRDVVVGAGVEGGDLVALALAHREDDDRNDGPAAQAADHLDAVDSGQAEVEDDEVGVLARGDGRALPRRSARARRRSRARAGSSRARAGSAARRRRRGCGSFGRLADATTIVSPPPGVSSTSISPPIASTKPSRPRGRARRLRPSSSRRGAGTAGTGGRVRRRHARPLVDDADVDVAVGRPGRDARRDSGGREPTALSITFASARSSRPGSARTRRQRLGHVELDRVVADAEAAAAPPGAPPRGRRGWAGSRARRSGAGSCRAGCRRGRSGGRSPRRSSRGTRGAPPASSRRRPGAGSSPTP